MIHKTAVVDPKAKLSSDVEIGPYSVIGPNVEIGEKTIIYSHTIISGNTTIGKQNTIYPFASIGTVPQDLKFNGESTKLKIGDNNTIREYVTINPGTIGDSGVTLIGDGVVIGGNSAVQQFTRIGKMAMIGGMTGVLNDVIPYGLSIGNRNFLQGLNLIGLRRKNIPNKEILSLSDAYKEIFKTDKLTVNLNNLNGAFKENSLVNEVIEFINKDKRRPICTPFSK